MWRFLIASFAGILSFHGLSCTAQVPSYSFVRDGSEAPTESYYDYIIIGGGTAGCPLAATLSESSKVLLLEKGGSPYGNDNVTNLSSIMNILCDHSPTSPSQGFVSEDGIPNTRARILGGGTSINGGFYTRASADYVRGAGWDVDSVDQSYRWVESLLVEEPRLLRWQSAVRDGLVEAGVTPDNGFTYDHLHGTKTGGTMFDGDGHRRTAADLLQHANPDGIEVFLHATVHRILFRHEGEPRPVASGVIFMDAQGKTHRAYLKEGPGNEIISTAGAIGSPQLLMLSGVGPADHLKSLGIDVIMDQPLVGQGMSDNPMNVVFIPSPSPVEISLVQHVGITRFGSYIESVGGTKYFTCPSAAAQEAAQHLACPSAEEEAQRRSLGMISSETSYMPPMATSPIATEAIKSQEDSYSSGGFILEKVANPLSTGHLELRNTNPNENPSVTFNYFKEPEDLQACVEGIRTIERVVHSEAFSKFIYPNTSIEALLAVTENFLAKMPPSHDKGPRSLEQYCKDTMVTIWHYHGGCQVGRVVDHDYRVLGVDAVRVIDGSTFESSPGTNPQATIMMLGRYMGLKIQNERLDKEGTQ